MGMIKVESGNMGPPTQSVVREESVDVYKVRGSAGGRSGKAGLPTPSSRKRGRESDGEDSGLVSGRKKTRG